MKSGVFFLSLTALVITTVAAQLDGGATEAPPAISVEELGRLLFWDPILSGGKDVACATCHHPDFAYADGRDLSLGPGSVGLGPSRTDLTGGLIPVVKRNSPTVLNTVFNGVGRGRRNREFDGTSPGTSAPNRASLDQTRAPMFWDRRIRSLETQALEPIKAFEEMRGSAYAEEVAVDSAIARLRDVPEYVALFEQAFGQGTSIDADQLGGAIAAFQRSLVAMNSPFDQFEAGDRTALTAQQQRGRQAFDDVGCDRCHRGPMFSNYSLQAEGVGENAQLSEPDEGAGRFRFRTPTLRNVALTAPYMHNGTIATLPQVLRFYDAGRSENPNVVDGGRDRGQNRSRDGDRNLGPNRRGNGGGNGGRRGSDDARPQPGGGGNETQPQLSRGFQRVDDMSDQEMHDIVAFLEALTDEDFDKTIPVRVPSGLPPGGAIQAR
jgi:cytochrome c peroxidase